MPGTMTSSINTAKPARSLRPIWEWTIALVGAVALNISLFGLMPGLIQRIPDTPDQVEAYKHVQVIRIKRPEQPPRKKEPPKQIKPKPVNPVVKQVRQTRVEPRKMTEKPRLDFELNPRLPAVSTDLAVPLLETFSLEAPRLKNIYDMAELDSDLTPLVRIPSVYPFRAKRRGIEGFVTVEFVVNAKGLVENITIVDAEPETVFNKSVLKSVSQWKFTPPTVEGIPVSARARTTVRFQLDD